MIDGVVTRGARIWRSVAGDKSAFERLVKRRYRSAVRKETGRHATLYSGQNEVVVISRRDPEHKVGIFLKGGCDMPIMFLTGPAIQESIRSGTVAIVRPREAAGSSHSRQLLQAADGIEPELVAEVCHRLQIPRAFFRPALFEPTFPVRQLPQLGHFPKTVVALSTGSDLTRTLFRHRQNGVLVDIGGWWLNQSLEKAIQDTDTLKWFRDTFEPAGRIGVSEFQSNFAQIISRLKAMGAYPLVFNSLAIDPLSPTHNYQLLNLEQATRRREFNIAIAELSRSVGFHIIDVDRLLKQQGVREQVDFAHAPLEAKLVVAQESFRVLRELEVL